MKKVIFILFILISIFINSEIRYFNRFILQKNNELIGIYEISDSMYKKSRCYWFYYDQNKNIEISGDGG